MQKHVLTGLCVLGLVFFSAPIPVYAEGPAEIVTVVAEGIGFLGSGGDEAVAKEEAFEHAKRNAVEKAAGVYLASETITNNYTVLQDRILTRAQGYIVEEPKVLEQGFVAPAQKGKPTSKTYRMVIQARIAIGNIYKDIKQIPALMPPVGNPRLIVVVSERNVGRMDLLALTNPGETELTRILVDAGCDVLDLDQVRANSAADMLRKAMSGDIAAAAAIGTQNKAEIVIVGHVSSAFQSKITIGVATVNVCKATLSYKLVGCDTARIISTKVIEATDSDGSPELAGEKAIRKTAKLSGKDILGELVRFSTKLTQRYSLEISGLNLERYESLLRELIRNRGVVNIYKRGFDPVSTTVDVDFNGQGTLLAKKLRNLESVPLKLERMTTNKLVLKTVR